MKYVQMLKFFSGMFFLYLSSNIRNTIEPSESTNRTEPAMSASMRYNASAPREIKHLTARLHALTAIVVIITA